MVQLVREHLTLIDLATRRDGDDPQTIAMVVASRRRQPGQPRPAAGPHRGGRERSRSGGLDRLAGLPARQARHDRARGARRGRAAAGLVPRGRPGLRRLQSRIAVGQPVVVITPLGGAHRVDVYDRDRLGLFADTAGLLAAQGHIVRSAVVRTLDGVAANEWHVETPGRRRAGRGRPGPGLTRLAGGDREPLAMLARRRRATAFDSSRATSGSPGQTRAMVISHASDSATVIEVRAADRPGTAPRHRHHAARASLSVRSAHIATYAGQALDTFYVTEFGGRPLPPARVAQAVSMIIDTCDGGD